MGLHGHIYKTCTKDIKKKKKNQHIPRTVNISSSTILFTSKPRFQTLYLLQSTKKQTNKEQSQLEIVPTDGIIKSCSFLSINVPQFCLLSISLIPTWLWFHGFGTWLSLNVIGLLKGTEACGSGKGLLWEGTMKVRPWFSSIGGANSISCIAWGFENEASSS